MPVMASASFPGCVIALQVQPRLFRMGQAPVPSTKLVQTASVPAAIAGHWAQHFLALLFVIIRDSIVGCVKLAFRRALHSDCDLIQ